MKFRKIYLAYALIISLSFVFGVYAASMYFNDVDDDHWAAESIYWAADRGLMTGPDDNSGNFNINGNVNRAEMATIMQRLYKVIMNDLGEEVDFSAYEIDDEDISQNDEPYKYADGVLPLGDYKYTFDSPKKGYIYSCQTSFNGGGAQVDGDWIDGDTWDKDEKIAVQGSVDWPNAYVSIYVDGDDRIFSSNDLPDHTTGVFPVDSDDPAYQIDRNPNSIKEQEILYTLPANPDFADEVSCVGGEVGIMNNGVMLFNGFDAGGRDAVAHEVQDSCDGHPQKEGLYHYHGMSDCFKDLSSDTVVGYAFDGFPITGPKIDEDSYLTTDDLDECHGTTSEILFDGEKVNMYHYVLTEDFPYSVSCYKGKPVMPKH